MKNVDNWIVQLKDNKLIVLDSELAAREYPTPWYLRVLSGFCGWLAAFFLLSFLGLVFPFLYKNQGAMFFMGGLYIVTAFGIFRQKSNDFVEHLGLAVSLTGQFYIAFALFSSTGINHALPLLIMTLFQIALSILMPNYIHRILSAYFATVSLSLLMGILHMSSFFSAVMLLLIAFIWLNEYTLTRKVSALQAIGYGLTISLIQFKTSMLFSFTNTWQQEGLPIVNAWLDEGLNTIVLLFVIYLMRNKDKLFLPQKDKWIAIALFVLLVVMNVFANGIVCGFTILLIGYGTHNRALTILGVVALLINLSSYYYLLDLSLLSKSVVLMSTGASCLFIVVIWQKLSKREAVNEN